MARSYIEFFLQLIANTAGFHFAAIEQGGSSLYPQQQPGPFGL